MATPRMTRPERKADTRERLLAAAEHVFADRGFHRASVEEIAEEAGFSTGAVYSNFDGKEDLFLTLLERVVARTTREVAAAVAERPTLDDRARTAARQWMTFLEREPTTVLLFIEFWAFAVREPSVRPRFGARYAEVRRSIARMIEDGARDLHMELTVPAEQLATIADALADGFALQRLIDPDAVPPELLGTALSLLLSGASRPRAGG